ncbi:isocitrate dehydrogenase (NADP(+)) [Chromatiales bacterium (ex Bugula neritina AB1)]|nr:isocitrate dehydrogenase (NADP(+)) [Chromatiales bacterium (ex Bugula neritina AB1)]
MSTNSKIVYTWTDEAPALATLSWLPIVQAFTSVADISIETRDISLSARILSAFSDTLPQDQKVEDALAALGELAKTPEANIIKLPNISASVPQLKAAIKELQDAGYNLPDHPDAPGSPKENDDRNRYNTAKGSAVNPVLREGNSDRRAPAAVKNYAKKNPHSMGAWTADSQTHVSSMQSGDFRSNEKSRTFTDADALTVTHIASSGEETVMVDSIAVQPGEIVDATFMSKRALLEFLEAQIQEAKEQGVLFSLHLKATMMKISDPIIFGHAVRVFFRDLFDQHAEALDRAGVNVNNGFGNLLNSLSTFADDECNSIQQSITKVYETRPDIAMVNSDKGITNLHVPSDIIVDASMPAMIRSSGKMWDKEGAQRDTKAVIPDSSYAALYQTTIDFHKKHGAFDPATMGTCPNVGLMAQKAEEYGSHDKTFECPADGTIRVTNQAGKALFEHTVESGDIWRACQVKDAPIRDWVKLAVGRARATGWPTVFWLDQDRAHDAELIEKVKTYLQNHDTDGLTVKIMSVSEATQYTLERMQQGENTISVTGNVLRDYLTDLFPILELGTSAKMLSIVPLMNGGGLFETGAGGSAPKHVQQFEKENHLRWDSLGEFLALAVSLEHLAEYSKNDKARLLAQTLDRATEKLLSNGKSPSRKVGELDTRGSHFYQALYWAQELAAQNEDTALASRFVPLAQALTNNEQTISDELTDIQGQPVNTGGYYHPDLELSGVAMRPSATLNKLIDEFSQEP